MVMANLDQDDILIQMTPVPYCTVVVDIVWCWLTLAQSIGMPCGVH